MARASRSASRDCSRMCSVLQSWRKSLPLPSRSHRSACNSAPVKRSFMAEDISVLTKTIEEDTVRRGSFGVEVEEMKPQLSETERTHWTDKEQNSKIFEEVPQTQYVDRVVDEHVVLQRQVPTISRTPKTVEISQTPFIDKMVDVLVVTQRPIPTIPTVQKPWKFRKKNIRCRQVVHVLVGMRRQTPIQKV